MKKRIASSFLVLALGLGAYAFSQSDSGFRPETALKDVEHVVKVDHYTDHGNGVRSRWGLNLSGPLFDSDGHPVVVVAYHVDFFPKKGEALIGYTNQMTTVRGDLAEEISYQVAGMSDPNNTEEIDEDLARIYTISFKPRGQLNWANVSSSADYTASVTFKLMKFPY